MDGEPTLAIEEKQRCDEGVQVIHCCADVAPHAAQVTRCAVELPNTTSTVVRMVKQGAQFMGEATWR